MAETINMPKLGFDMAEGTLIRWVKQVGENINKGDVLAEIETDKATVEVESPASGVVLQHMVDQGSVVPVNAPIAVVGNAGEKVDAPAAAPAENRKQDRTQQIVFRSQKSRMKSKQRLPQRAVSLQKKRKKSPPLPRRPRLPPFHKHHLRLNLQSLVLQSLILPSQTEGMVTLKPPRLRRRSPATTKWIYPMSRAQAPVDALSAKM